MGALTSLWCFAPSVAARLMSDGRSSSSGRGGRMGAGGCSRSAPSVRRASSAIGCAPRPDARTSLRHDSRGRSPQVRAYRRNDGFGGRRRHGVRGWSDTRSVDRRRMDLLYRSGRTENGVQRSRSRTADTRKSRRAGFVQLQIFTLDGAFTGTVHLIRSDLYQGQPCPPTGRAVFLHPRYRLLQVRALLGARANTPR